MKKQQNYRLMVEVRDMTKVKGQINPFNDPVPGTQIIVELDGDDLEHIMYRRLFEFWNREDAEISALGIWRLWNDRFGRKTKLSKKAVKQYMFDIESVVKSEANY
ncbi:MAG: hypothetical protein ACOY46_19625 [Bacillota bacterium]